LSLKNLIKLSVKLQKSDHQRKRPKTKYLQELLVFIKKYNKLLDATSIYPSSATAHLTTADVARHPFSERSDGLVFVLSKISFSERSDGSKTSLPASYFFTPPCSMV